MSPLWEDVYIEDKTGKLVPLSQQGWECKTGPRVVSMNIDITLWPNTNFSRQDYTSEVDLDKMFRIYQSGTFKICDSYYLMDNKKRFQGGGGLVISEPIFIEVTK